MSSPDLTPSESEHATRLHRESIVADTAYGSPTVYLPDLVERTTARLEEGLDPAAVIDEYDRDQRRALWWRCETREQYRKALHATGVTLGAVTVGGGGWTYRAAVQEIAEWRELLDHLPELIVQVVDPRDMARVKEQGKLGIVFHFQNATHFEDDLDNVDVFFGLGVRIVQLTYNDQNLVGSGCTEPGDGGLTRFGREIVSRLNDLGIIVDLSHCGPRTTADSVDLSRAAPCVTHAACSAVATHPRNKSDEQIRAIAARGGYFGVAILPMFLTGTADDATSDDFFTHLLHAVDVAGIDHVGVGMDWSARPPEFALPLSDRISVYFERLCGIRSDITLGASSRVQTIGIDGVHGWPDITRGLVARGFPDEDIRKLLGLNFVRYWERVQADGIGGHARVDR